MAEIIYSKYSNERSRQFAIRTDILEEGGRRFVRKTALYEEGKAHEKSLLHWYEKLTDLYQASGFSCNRCEEKEEGVILEYLQEQTLEESLDTWIEAGKIKEAAENLITYLEEIQRMHKTEKFTVTEEFQKIFGEVSLPENLKCSAVTNIDLLCGNLVLTKVPTIIDYEWTFDFPIPAEYVLYRVIHYYLETNRIRAVLKEFSLYERFGIDEKLRKIFEKMEQHFQGYITGKHIPIREMFSAISPGAEIIQVVKQEVLQIFFLEETGYREEHSVRYPLKEGKVTASVSIPEGCTALRIDPGEKACAVKFEVCAFDGTEAEIKEAYIPEGYWMDEWLYIAKNDPNIINLPVPSGAQKLNISLQIFPASEQLLKSMAEKDLCSKKKIKDLEEVILVMKQTRVWKWYEKYRNFVERK